MKMQKVARLVCKKNFMKLCSVHDKEKKKSVLSHFSSHFFKRLFVMSPY